MNSLGPIRIEGQSHSYTYPMFQLRSILKMTGETNKQTKLERQGYGKKAPGIK